MPPPTSEIQNLTFDGERAIPDLMHGTAVMRDQLEGHLRRYRFVSRFVSGRSVLDAACGVGYGTAMLREATDQPLVGVDSSAEAVAYARRRYTMPSVTFVHADLEEFFWAPEAFGAVVSLETLEHLRSPEAFIRRVRDRLPAGGIFAASTPVTPMLAEDPF